MSYTGVKEKSNSYPRAKSTPKSDNIDVLLRKLRVHAFSHGVTWKLTP